jgi:hypothetical protein
VSIANTGAGHHVPTGQPMRNMLLVVSPIDANGRDLRLLSGDRIPGWGGTYSGRPGKGFAKILATISEYARSPIAEEFTSGATFPAPFWRRNRIVSDNRIPAKGQVSETYLFDLGGAAQPVTLTTKLVYRRAFERLAELKAWPLNDVELAVNRLRIERTDEPRP